MTPITMETIDTARAGIPTVTAWSPTARLHALRAARKIAKQAARDGWAVVDANGDPSEVLQERSYEEALARNVYQSDERVEQWFDWRTTVELSVIAAIVDGSRS